jgi:rhodanese-related sulfurtransferase
MSSLPSYREVSPNDVQTCLERGDAVCLVDVRQPYEYAEYHIPNARLLPLGELSARFAAEIDPTDTIICICEHGVRSRHAADFLAQQGYEDVATMTGGMAAYPGPVEAASAES